MLEFNFQIKQQPELIKKARELALSSNGSAVAFLIKQMGVRPSNTRNEAYYGEVLDYLCGNLFAHANMPAEAAAAIEASNVLPYAGGDVPYHDAARDGVAIGLAQDEAIERGAPAIMLASMPRAASAALTQTLAKITGAPIVRISIGAFPDYWLVPVWLNRFLRGGAILHDHFSASEFNLNALRSSGVDTVNVLVRDPRAAAVSFAKLSFGAQATDDSIAYAYSQYLPWLQGWIDAEKSRAINIRWIRSRDVIGGSDGLNAVLTALLGHGSPFAAAIRDVTLAVANVSGQKADAWRNSVSSGLRRKMWDRLSAEIIDRLELHQ